MPVVEVLPLSKAVGDFGIVKRNGPPEFLQGGALNPFDLAGEARNVSLLLASAVNAEGYREILGICEGAKEKADAVTAELRRQRLTRAAELVEMRVGETLTCYAFPDIHWQKIRTNNPLERIMKKIRRRTRVVGAFPDGQSCLNLAAVRLRHIAGTQWSARKHMNMAPLCAAPAKTAGAVA